jgi:hypothetical protein
MLLYDMGDPIRAVEVLGPTSAASTSRTPGADRPPAGGARRSPWARARSTSAGSCGPPGVGYAGPLVVEREVGDQAARIRDIAHGLDFLRECLAAS